MYSYKENVLEQIMNDLGTPISSIDLSENIISWGLGDSDVFTPLDGIRKVISAWALEWCD